MALSRGLWQLSHTVSGRAAVQGQALRGRKCSSLIQRNMDETAVRVCSIHLYSTLRLPYNIVLYADG